MLKHQRHRSTTTLGHTTLQFRLDTAPGQMSTSFCMGLNIQIRMRTSASTVFAAAGCERNAEVFKVATSIGGARNLLGRMSQGSFVSRPHRSLQPIMRHGGVG